MKFDPTDPKWTAYALGELEPTERAAIDQELAQSPAAQQFVAEIQETTKLLIDGLCMEPTPTLSGIQKAQVNQQLGTPKTTVIKPMGLRKVPRTAWVVAASVMLIGLLFLPVLQRGYRVAQHIPSSRSLSTLDEDYDGADEVNVRFAKPDREPEKWHGPKVDHYAVGETPDEPPNLTTETLQLAEPREIMQEEQINSSPNDASEVAGGNLVGQDPVTLGLEWSGRGFKGRGQGVRKAMVGSYGGSNSGRQTHGFKSSDSRSSRLPSDSHFAGKVQGDKYGNLGMGAYGGFSSDSPTTVTGGKYPAFEGQRSSEAYDLVTDNSFMPVREQPLSTFSIDVDTASYSNIRRLLTQNHLLPPKGAVRIEELINYFHYDYPQPKDEKPFSVTTEVAGCPWNAEHRLVRIGLKGREIAPDKRPPSNLVFLLDVSGSMSDANKLPLVREAMKLLAEQLNENDRVAIVVYAGQSGVVLPSTTGDKQQLIREAIDQLEAGGSTNGAGGIQLAYDIAAGNFIKGATNRVILATDGDFNVGITNRDELLTLITEKAKSGVFLTTLGFGMGNLKDGTLEQLADKGNGNYAYIDDMREAKKVFVEQMNGTLITIAKDVKIQIEFNPAKVAAFRLIGYENRILAHEDFNNDKKDTGEIGAGHTVTALCEIEPASGDAPAAVDPLKYQPAKKAVEQTDSDELLTVKLRYKQPDGDMSKLIEAALKDSGTAFGKATTDFKFAASVALFGMLLRDSPYKGAGTFDAAGELAEEGKGENVGGYRAEFIELVKQAKALRSR